MGVGNWSKKDARSWEVGIAVWREDKTGLQPLLRYVYMQTQWVIRTAPWKGNIPRHETGEAH